MQTSDFHSANNDDDDDAIHPSGEIVPSSYDRMPRSGLNTRNVSDTSSIDSSIVTSHWLATFSSLTFF